MFVSSSAYKPLAVNSIAASAASATKRSVLQVVWKLDLGRKEAHDRMCARDGDEGMGFCKRRASDMRNSHVPLSAPITSHKLTCWRRHATCQSTRTSVFPLSLPLSSRTHALFPVVRLLKRSVLRHGSSSRRMLLVDDV